MVRCSSFSYCPPKCKFLQASNRYLLQTFSPRIFKTPGLHLTDYCFAVTLNHFRLLRVVGKGAFGKVRIVERKDSGLTFALKYIRKDEGPFEIVSLTMLCN